MFEQIEFWHWWVLAALLVGIEIFVPSTILLWPAVGAAIVGFLLLIFGEIGWHTQLVLFAALSLVSVLAWRAYRRKYPEKSDEPTLNRRAERYVDRVFTLDQPIVNGEGTLKVDDTTWKIVGSDLAPGTRVKVVAVTGLTLKVEKA